jgi:asparagine synthase (glutamine-hydrolysing)
LQKLDFALPSPQNEGKVAFPYKLMRFLRAAPLTTAQAHCTWNGSFLPSFAGGLVLREARPHVEHALDWAGDAPVSLLGLQRCDLAHYLPSDILSKGDRMSMACGLEARAPFLEHELAGWALALPDPLKLKGGRLKRLLREAARQVFGPEISDRPKQGFSIPVHAWLRAPEGQIVREFLSPDRLQAIGVFEVSKVQEILRQHMARERSWGFELWGLAVLSAWHERRVRKAPAPPTETRLLERVL